VTIYKAEGVYLDEPPDLLIWGVTREREPKLTGAVDADSHDPLVVFLHDPIEFPGHSDLLRFGPLGHSPAFFFELSWDAA
jgi:hypothetical protein